MRSALLTPSRESRLSDFKTPGELAKALNPTTVQTPALQVIDNAFIEIDRAVQCMLARRKTFSRFRAQGMSEEDALLAAEVEIPTEGINRLMISMPPQEGKSERSTHYGVLWLLRRHPVLRIAIVSYEHNVARRMSYLIRNDIQTFDGTDGNIDLGLRLRRDSRSVSSWGLLGEEGTVYAVGIGGALTSRPVDLLLIDDPVKDYRAADSELQSQTAWDWYQAVARPRLAPGAPACLILTRWHEKDMAGRLQAKQKEDEASEVEHYDKWHIINIPAQADHHPENGEVDVLGREPGEFMVSARGRTRAQWEATKVATSPRIWSGLYQGRPTPEKGDVFHRDWWMRYSTPLWTTEADGTYHVHDASEIVQSWDMTFKDKKSSDFVVGQVWVRRGAYAYLVDQVRGRWSFTQTVEAFRRLTAKWPQALAKFVEDTANGPAVISSLRSEIGGIIPITVKGSKLARASAVSPVVQSNNVFLPDTFIALFNVEELVDEATQFPNSANDDQVDALTQALDRMYLKGSGGKDWLESLAPPCAECGQPNAKEALLCTKCGAELPVVTQTVAEASASVAPAPVALDFNQAALEAIKQFGPNQQGWQPFQRSGW